MLLSVVIPVYHGAITVQKLVESTQAQLKEYAFEIILINDGSKDDSEKKCLRNKTSAAEFVTSDTFCQLMVKS